MSLAAIIGDEIGCFLCGFEVDISAQDGVAGLGHFCVDSLAHAAGCTSDEDVESLR